MNRKKYIFPILIAVALLGTGVMYQNCGQMDAGSLSESSLSGKTSQDKQSDTLLVTLKDGTKMEMVKKPSNLEPLIVTLQDGTILEMVPQK